MLVVHVYVHVKPECVEAFREASVVNARQSVQEPGIARFDVLQQADDPTRFVLVEVYRTPQDPARHKETAHYASRLRCRGESIGMRGWCRDGKRGYPQGRGNSLDFPGIGRAENIFGLFFDQGIVWGGDVLRCMKEATGGPAA